MGIEQYKGNITGQSESPGANGTEQEQHQQVSSEITPRRPEQWNRKTAAALKRADDFTSTKGEEVASL
jgi:hypothetical protein